MKLVCVCVCPNSDKVHNARESATGSTGPRKRSMLYRFASEIRIRVGYGMDVVYWVTSREYSCETLPGFRLNGFN